MYEFIPPQPPTPPYYLPLNTNPQDDRHGRLVGVLHSFSPTPW
jgi:hypothetical protein